MEFIDPRKTPYVPVHSRGELPHLYKPGAWYFVTFRLADAITSPVKRAQKRSTIVDLDPHEIVADLDPPLTLGSCVLHREEVAATCQAALLEYEARRYVLGAWCVMPNHVHAVFAPLPGHTPDKILQSWKGGSARQINLLLGRQGSLWERESFDHLVRSERSLRKFV